MTIVGAGQARPTLDPIAAFPADLLHRGRKQGKLFRGELGDIVCFEQNTTPLIGSD